MSKKTRDKHGRFATATYAARHALKQKQAMRTITLSVPAHKAFTVALGKTVPFSYSTPDSALEIFIPSYDWMRWADTIQQHPHDSAYFLAAAHSPYMLVALDIPTDSYAAFTDPTFDLSRTFPNQEWPQGWDDRFAVLIIDAETAAQWLVDNPIEV